MYQLRDYQKDAVQAVYQHLREKDNNPCAVLPTGCHAKGHPILMFDGTVRKFVFPDAFKQGSLEYV